MYSISELSDEERKYLFGYQSFSDYATEVEDFSRIDSASMLRIADQREGATEPKEAVGVVRSDPVKYHWMLSGGQCRFLRIEGRMILSSQGFGELIRNGESSRACKYCVADYLYR